MNVVFGGGVGEHGRNSFYVEGDTAYIVDCGIMRGDSDPYPRLSVEQIKSARYLFLTHPHEDHIGAFSHFAKSGFCGTVIGAEETLSALPKYDNRFIIPQSKSVISLSGVVFSYGRSGHCAGAVWYRISTQKGCALFSGDYSEDSAFCVDKIENLSANIAVLDCAFGKEEYNAGVQLKKICAYVQERAGVILPVPKNGRAVDLICSLSALGKRIYIDGAQADFLQKNLNSPWVRREAAEAINKVTLLPLREYKGEGIAFISDAQLAREDSIAFVQKYPKNVLFTGHTDNGSFAEKLLRCGAADKTPYNAHCNKLKADEIISRNSFKKIVYYHCGDPVITP